jgi:hypothetical protein
MYLKEGRDGRIIWPDTFEDGDTEMVLIVFEGPVCVRRLLTELYDLPLFNELPGTIRTFDLCESEKVKSFIGTLEDCESTG